MSAGKHYRSYLLRLWRTADGSWRAALEDPHTGEQQAFATLEQLSEHLARATRAAFAAAEGAPPAAGAAAQPPDAKKG